MPELKPAKLRLLELAAKIARSEYLPSLERCKTLRAANAEIRAMDDRHGQLAMELKAIWDELPEPICPENVQRQDRP